MRFILHGGNPPHIPGRITPAGNLVLGHVVSLVHLVAHALPHCR